MTRSEAGKLGYEKTKVQLGTWSVERGVRLREEHLAKDPRCKFCEASISFEKRKTTFCSHSCASKFNNTRKISRARTCELCPNPLKSNTKYCTDCWNSKPEIRTRREWDTAKSNPACRFLLVRDRGKCCEVCKNAAWMGEDIPLEVDHIDGDSDNWNKQNMRLVCPNCHAQTDTYKGRNKGRGRYARRKRYQEGKSY